MSSPDWAPSVEAVAAYIPSRTSDSNGDEPGTFTRDTRPTAAQVSEVADQAAEDILASVGGSLPQQLEPVARRVAALLAAMHVELTYFPEQVDTGPYDRMKDLYDERLAALIGRVGDIGSGDANAAGSGLPAYGFPDLTTSVSWRPW